MWRAHFSAYLQRLFLTQPPPLPSALYAIIITLKMKIVISHIFHLNKNSYLCTLFTLYLLSSFFFISLAYVNAGYLADHFYSQVFFLSPPLPFFLWCINLWVICSLHGHGSTKQTQQQKKGGGREKKHVRLSGCCYYPVMSCEDFHRTTWEGFYDVSLWLITRSWRDVRLSETDNADFYPSAFLCKTCHQSSVSRP